MANTRRSAGVTELVDAPDSKSGGGNYISVRFRSSVCKKAQVFYLSFFFVIRQGLAAGIGGPPVHIVMRSSVDETIPVDNVVSVGVGVDRLWI